MTALELPFDGSAGVAIPTSNQRGVELLASYQFSQEIVRTHMRYGLPATHHHREVIYAQTSPALG